MLNLTSPLDSPLSLLSKPQFSQRWAKTLVSRQLEQMQTGGVVLHAGTELHFGQVTADFSLSADIFVEDDAFFRDILFGGVVGAAEAYMAGYWRCSNLVDLVRILIRNRPVLEGMNGHSAWLTRKLRKLMHSYHLNTRQGSRRNIAAHYDLGNDFFQLFLDETLLYSCAYFECPEASLYQASIAKLALICAKLQLKPEDHVIEVGCGWGGFAEYAATHYGCRVTATTISRQQFEFAQQRIQAAGLSDRVTLLFEDYRDLTGTYDKLVSIEMVEAIGHQYYETYFAKCAQLLKPDGLALIQAITIADQQYEKARDDVDFIKRYIFPGSCIPSVTALVQAMTKASDFNLLHLQDIGGHYALTLQRWREAFLESIESVREQGYSEEFIRMWEFYLAYCEGAYRERAIGNAHLLLAKSLYRETDGINNAQHYQGDTAHESL
jgi:cyclopropane-fatty-acyl-phospholipid synthase